MSSFEKKMNEFEQKRPRKISYPTYFDMKNSFAKSSLRENST